MESKIHREYQWVQTHGGRNYEVIVKTSAPQIGPSAYGQPVITVLIDGQWVADEALSGNPEITEAFARQFVQERFEDWVSLHGLDT